MERDKSPNQEPHLKIVRPTPEIPPADTPDHAHRSGLQVPPEVSQTLVGTGWYGIIRIERQESAGVPQHPGTMQRIVELLRGRGALASLKDNQIHVRFMLADGSYQSQLLVQRAATEIMLVLNYPRSAVRVADTHHVDRDPQKLAERLARLATDADMPVNPADVEHLRQEIEEAYRSGDVHAENE